MKRIPVVLDTDIGGDIDDIWALCYLLKCPELETRFVLTAAEDTLYKANIVCKFLEEARRTDLPVGIGIPTTFDPNHKTHLQWVEGYAIDHYPGVVHQDGVGAFIDLVRASKEPITLICIGPLPNIHAALKRAPDIASKCHFVGMHGSVRTQHEGKAGAIAEFNVIKDVPAAQAVLSADWLSITITPLDSCGIVRLVGDQYQTVKNCREPALAAVIENYRLWQNVGDQFPHQSSILFDTVAIYLAFAREMLAMEDLRITVTSDGFIRIDPKGKPMAVATGWKDLAGYYEHLVKRLTGDVLR